MEPEAITGRDDAITEAIADLHAETHESLRILREIHALLTEFRPLIDAWRASGNGSLGLARLRKAARGG